MRQSKNKAPSLKELGERAGKFLAAALGPIEEQLGAKTDQIGELSVIFTWNDADYRVALSRYSEAAPKHLKANKRGKAI